MSRSAMVILEPHKPLGGFLGMMGAPTYGRAARRVGLRGAVPGAAAGLSPSQMSTVGGGGTPVQYNFAGDTPSWGVSDYLYSAATGNVSQNVATQLQQEEAASLQQAGESAADANAQASSDVTDALSTYVGPGAFGVITTGAAPGQGIIGALNSALGISSIPGWAWLAIGGVGLLVLVKAIK